MSDIQPVQDALATEPLSAVDRKITAGDVTPAKEEDVLNVLDQPSKAARLPEQSPLKKVPKTDDVEAADVEVRQDHFPQGGASQTVIPDPSEFGLASQIGVAQIDNVTDDVPISEEPAVDLSKEADIARPAEDTPAVPTEPLSDNVDQVVDVPVTPPTDIPGAVAPDVATPAQEVTKDV
jgi:hypothetical protein